MHGLIIFVSLFSLCKTEFLISIQRNDGGDPPEPWQTAQMARYIIHNADWVALATISTQKGIIGYPFVSLKSLSDGPSSNGTGIPYLYMTHLDVSGKDIEVDNRVTIMASLAELEFCKSQDYDPQDPRCAKLYLTGNLLKLDNTTQEYQFGEKSLYERHPSMKSWPADHGFYVAKVNISQIELIDYFGGIKYVTVEEYFKANVSMLFKIDELIRTSSVINVIG